MIVSKIEKHRYYDRKMRKLRKIFSKRTSEMVMRASLMKFAQITVKSINKDILYGEKTGREYVRRFGGVRKRRHQASASTDQSQANLHGNMRRSLGYKISGFNHLEIGYGVRKTKEAPDYADVIENGGVAGNGARIKGRKSLTKGIKRNLGHLQTSFNAEFNKQMRRL